MTLERELTENQKAFNAWLKTPQADKPQFVAFVDGDVVEKGNNFPNVAINASQLKTQRGTGAQLDIFDSQSKETIPS